jgi:hypothetical protein
MFETAFVAGASCAASAIVSACTPIEAASDFFGVDAGPVSTTVSIDALGARDDELDQPSPIPDCPSVRSRPTQTLGSSRFVELTEDETWSCTSNVVIDAPVLIQPGVTLSVGPDTRIFARPGAYVLSQRGARLIVEGTAEAPVVFSSAEPPGQRRPGDWRGILLAGGAPTHAANAPLPGTVSDERAYFGGGPSGSNVDDCGRLRYARIEFAGGNTDEEATPGAALSLGGCGTSTIVDFVQIHRATDGLGLLGGSVPIAHVVVSNNGLGNAIEWTGGYTGNLQFVIAQGAGAGAALKGSNSEADPARAPVSHPIIYNATLVGISPVIPSGSHYGLSLQQGSAASLRNSIITRFNDGAIDLQSEQTLALASPEEISHLTVYANGPGGATHLARAAAALASTSLRDRDPGLDAAAQRESPRFVPTDPGVNSDIAVTPSGFDATATFRGALPVEGEDWTLGWTDYPLD